MSSTGPPTASIVVSAAAASTSPVVVSRSSAMAALVSKVMENPELIRSCMSYQDGVKMVAYEDGDVAACSGHLSLLRLRRGLCRKGRLSKGGVGNTSTFSGEAGASGSCSSRTTSTKGVEERASGNTEKEVEGGNQVSAAVEVDEGHADVNEDVLLLEDLKFSHLAVDWAAAQGHLAVVRSASQSTFVFTNNLFA